jgi:hypothetical protein
MQPNATPTTQSLPTLPQAAPNAVRAFNPAAPVIADAGPGEPPRRVYIRIGGQLFVGYRA